MTVACGLALLCIGAGGGGVDLAALKLGKLHELALARGLDEGAVDACFEADRPKAGAVGGRVIQRRPPSARAQSVAQ